MSLSVEQRRNEIIDLIAKKGSVRVSEISQTYGISEVTIRADLEYLEGQGHLNRVRGGAVGTGKLYANMDLGERYLTNAGAKKALADLACNFIQDNDTIMMNAGTTLTYILHAIQGKKNVRIVTNSIQNAMEITSLPGFEVVLLGGEIDKKYQFTFGADAQNQLDAYHANKCILSVDGIDQKDGLSLYYSNESSIVRKMIESSDEVIVVADSTKIGKSAFSIVAPLTDMDVLVTNRTDKKEELNAIKELGIEVYTTKK